MSKPSITESISRTIQASERAGTTLTEIIISDAAAWELAGEIAMIQIVPRKMTSDIYEDMKSGRAKFLDRKVVVT